MTSEGPTSRDKASRGCRCCTPTCEATSRIINTGAVDGVPGARSMVGGGLTGEVLDIFV